MKDVPIAQKVDEKGSGKYLNAKSIVLYRVLKTILVW